MSRMSIPATALRLFTIAAFAVALAGAGEVRQARAHDWVGPAIVGALIGGAIAHHAYRHHHRYARPYHRKYAKSYRRHYRPHAYYAPAIVVPLPFVYVGPRW
ncbi:MAG: hypothetical protein BroJett030_28650 [Alphaproteobacteria bacterium]|nr:MAG: hypothetical protein BroJett030_28650 [Alphaproteobacteria bacterium]